jgi:hypothetical protein
MQHCASRIGDAYFRTPRETLKGFLDLLALLDQHPDLEWRSVIGDVDLTAASEHRSDNAVDDELSSFQL